jgi:gliding motility-associated-like protein
MCTCSNFCKAQCPPNIDFELGNFSNWTCYAGSVAAIGGQNTITLSSTNGPLANRHTMYSSANGGTDYFGGFPVTCPNGSGYSVKLGNNTGGGQAEGISYEFTIPANQNNYSLTYHYAVVFQDPAHQIHQQPRLEIEALNVSNGEVIYCSSFTFYPNGSVLPGFFLSPIEQDTTSVWCKNWTAVSMNLNGQAGKTIRLSFKTADCTFQKHFGYAYIDVNSECSSEFVGATFCSDDTTVSITAPFGYQSYTWFNNNFTQQLGNQQILNFSPPPLGGTTVAVQVVPYNGYGCVDTFYAKLMDTLKLKANAGADAYYCNNNPVTLGENPRQGVRYSWSPTTGLSDPTISNPRASPQLTTTYILTLRNSGGGCFSTDTVIVETFVIDTTIGLLGKDAFCITSNDSAVLFVNPATQIQIQWYKDNIPIAGAIQTKYRVTQTGAYHAVLTNHKGCKVATAVKNILIDAPAPGIRYPVRNAVENLPTGLLARPIGSNAVWSPTFNLNNALSYQPVFTGIQQRLYTITLTTISNCVTVDTQQVVVYKEIKFFVPSAFTPNGDGVNDYLKPVAAGFKAFKYFRVYNRWGVLLFTLQNSDELGWDGKYKGVPQPIQTVVWMAEGIGVDDKNYRQKGTCVLIR